MAKLDKIKKWMAKGTIVTGYGMHTGTERTGKIECIDERDDTVFVGGKWLRFKGLKKSREETPVEETPAAPAPTCKPGDLVRVLSTEGSRMNGFSVGDVVKYLGDCPFAPKVAVARVHDGFRGYVLPEHLALVVETLEEKCKRITRDNRAIIESLPRVRLVGEAWRDEAKAVPSYFLGIYTGVPGHARLLVDYGDLGVDTPTAPFNPSASDHFEFID